MKFNTPEARALYWFEMNAADTIPHAASMLSMRESTLRYQLDRLKSQGVLRERRAFIDSSVIGQRHYQVYLAFNPGGDMQGFLRAVADHPNVWWLAEIGGEYEVVFSFSTINIATLITMLENYVVDYQVSIVSKSVSIRASVHRFSRKYLVRSPIAPKVFSIHFSDEERILSTSDIAVLRSLAFRGEFSLRELAMQSGIPIATFERRKKALEEGQIIQGYFYELSQSALPIQQYIFLIETNGFDRSLQSRVYEFSFAHQYVRKMITCLGKWDIELEVHVVHYEELVATREECKAMMGDALHRLTIVPVFAHRSTPPFDPY